ncbi:hypothetical protein ABT160_16800 [Streptomyces sp. NPDC001941]|uniref:hypothetical protein n=1 Tax=Streptomyces sp. NPDC001941 TaxID=3154659 RepID=UPI003324B17E
MRRKAYGTASALLLTLAVSVTGCSGTGGTASGRTGSDSPSATATGSPSGAPATPSTAAPTAPPSTSPSTSATAGPTAPPPTGPGDSRQVLVTLTERGGFAGRNDSVVVYGDGRYLRSSPRTRHRPGRMSDDGLARLRASLARLDFSRLPGRPTGPPVADGLTRVLVHDGHTAVDDGTATPPELAAVYAALPPLT